MAESYTVVERLILLNSILPNVKGNMETLRAVDKWTKEVSFTQGEQTALNIRNVAGTLSWDAGAAMPVEIETSPLVKVAVQNVLREMDKAGTLQRQHILLWERFVEGKAPQRSPDGTPAEPVEVK